MKNLCLVTISASLFVVACGGVSPHTSGDSNTSGGALASGGSASERDASSLGGSNLDSGGSDAHSTGGSSTTTSGKGYLCGGSFVDAGIGSDLPFCSGKSYCYVQLPHLDSTGAAVPSCKAFTDSLASCADNPTCDCMCASYYHCQTECRCTQSAGLTTISCNAI